MKRKIPYSRQTIDQTDINAVIKVLKSDFLTQGATIETFENKLVQFCEARYVVVFSSGTAALHAACFAARIRPGDEAITTPMTFAASANCILYCGGVPAFADIKRDLPIIDPLEIKKKINQNTKVIIPVDYSGMPADYDEINRIARKYKLTVISDASHSLGATYKNKKVGTLTDMTVFSFHPVKAITTGEGGAVVTDNKKFYDRLLLFRTHGITKNPTLFINKNIGPWYYEMQELGYNYRLTDFQAVLGISQLKKIDCFIKKRQKIAGDYLKIFQDNKDINTIIIPDDRTSAWHLFPIRLSDQLTKHKKELIEKLHEKGIMVQVHYIPIHLHPYYRKKFGYKEGDFPNAEKFYHQEISLPIFPGITNTDIQSVVKEVFNNVYFSSRIDSNKSHPSG